jgi:hypothetical protein
VDADERFEPERIVDALNRGGVSYVIVGGLAVGAHGVIRATRDLDLVPREDPANMDRLASILSDLGGRHPITDELTGEDLARPVSMKIQTGAGEVHVLNRMPGTPTFDELEADRLLVEIAEGVEAPICSLAHLRQMKRASKRPRDSIDLAELDELHGPEPPG